MHHYLAALRTKPGIILTVGIVSLLTYLLGVTFLLIPALVAVSYLYLPVPSIYKTTLSKIFVAILFTFSLLPVVGAAQYVLFPGSDFTFTAIGLVLVQMLILLAVPAKKLSVSRFKFEREDLIPLLGSILIVLPFIPYLIGNDSLAHILSMASAQVVDAGNHFSAINHYVDKQFLSLGNYPAGFYYAAGFIIESFVGNLFEIGWRANAVLYSLQYVVMTSALIYSLYYFGNSIASVSGFFSRSKGLLQKKVLVGIGTISVVALFYALPFIAQGFLNYLYVIAAILCGVTYLAQGLLSEEGMSVRWLAFMFLVFGFGAVSSWSLLMPLLIAILVVYLLPDKKVRRKVLINAVFNVRSIPAILIAGCYFLLLYAQLTTIDISGQGGIYESGNLHDFHYLLLLIGVSIVSIILLQKKETPLQKLMVSVYVPMIAFVIGLALLQYFKVGEIRYYTIKSALLLEIMMIALCVVLLIKYLYLSKTLQWKKIVCVIFIPLVIVTILLSTSGNPLGPVRELFKPISGIPQPEFMLHDAGKFVELGTNEKLEHFNTITLHYDETTKKMDGYAQLTYKANLMRQSNFQRDIDMRSCNNKINALLEYGTASDRESPVIEAVNTCIGLAKEYKLSYYIITDAESVEHLRSHLQPGANFIY